LVPGVIASIRVNYTSIGEQAYIATNRGTDYPKCDSAYRLSVGERTIGSALSKRALAGRGVYGSGWPATKSAAAANRSSREDVGVVFYEDLYAVNGCVAAILADCNGKCVANRVGTTARTGRYNGVASSIHVLFGR
jgi:hypothetical protein